jgi:two-component system LytT family response regulator
MHPALSLVFDRIAALELKADGEYQVVLDTGARLRLSRRFRKRLQTRLGVKSA